jgi:alpha-mannosidase
LNGNDKKVSLESFNEIGKAKLTNLIEEEIKDLQVDKNTVKTELGHHSIETIKITNH